MLRISKFGVLATAIGVGTLIAGGAIAQDAEKAIKYRKGIMRAQGAHLGAIGAILKGEAGDASHIAGHAAALASLSTMLPDIFADGTGPDSGVETRALPAIWDDQAKFNDVVAATQAESAKLAEVAAGGDMGAIGAQVGALGKDGCGACHEGFRAKQQ